MSAVRFAPNAFSNRRCACTHPFVPARKRVSPARGHPKLFASPIAEAATAFVEKRAPIFTAAESADICRSGPRDARLWRRQWRTIRHAGNG
jgi:hypothetical protein